MSAVNPDKSTDDPTTIDLCMDKEKDYEEFTSKGKLTKVKEEEIEVVELVESGYEIPNEIEFVKVTPPKRKRTKIGKDGVERTEIYNSKKNPSKVDSLNESKSAATGKEEETPDDDDSGVNYLVIKTLSCKDGSNLLARIPGGYTEHWKCPVYITMLHRSLYYELKIWCQAIKDFVDNIDQRLKGTVYDCGWDPKQGDYIKKFVVKMEKVVRNKILQKRSVVLHSLNYEGIMHSFPGCDKEMSKILYNMCRSATFHVRFMMMMGPDGMTYDLGTLFSIGVEWSFGQYDNRTLF